MEHLKFVVFGALALSISSTLHGQDPPAACATIGHRAFDFWIGEWNVQDARGKLAGRNTITRAIGDCVLHEQYETTRGYSGQTPNPDGSVRQLWESSSPSGTWQVVFDGKYTRRKE